MSTEARVVALAQAVAADIKILLARTTDAQLRGLLMSGLSASDAGAVVSTDTLISAIGKLQARSLLGIPSAAATNAAVDFNDLTSAGWQPAIYGAAAGSRNANHPDGQTALAAGNGVVNYYWVLVIGYGATNRLQIAVPYLSSADTTQAAIKFRWKYGATSWTAWSAIPRPEQLATLTAAVAKLDNLVMQIGGIVSGAETIAVGMNWNKLRFLTTEIDTFTDIVQASGGAPTGNFYISRTGIYRFTCQLYLVPPANASAKVSCYLGLTSRGADGSGSTLLKVSNEELPGGQHPSITMSALVNVTAAGYYSFDWYFLDGASVTATLSTQTSPLYIWANIERVRSA